MSSRVRTPREQTNRNRPAVEVLEDRTVPHALLLLTDHNTLLTVDSSAPDRPLGPAVALTGLAANERILAIDFRPATGGLYGVSNQQRLYEIDSATGAVGEAFGLGNATFTGNAFGLDFDPVRDVALVQGEGRVDDRSTPSPEVYPAQVAGGKKRVIPSFSGLSNSPAVATTSGTTDAPTLSAGAPVTTMPVGRPGDRTIPELLPPDEGTPPHRLEVQMVGLDPSTRQAITYQPPESDNIGGIAFTNNVAGATSTTLYLIDFALDTLEQFSATQPDGKETKGPVGGALNVTSQFGFDIAADRTAYVSYKPAMVGGDVPSFLYTVNLENGSVALLGVLGGNQTVVGLSVIPPPPSAAPQATSEALAKGEVAPISPPSPHSSPAPPTIIGDVTRTVQVVKVRGKKGEETWKFRYDGPGLLRGPFTLVLYRNTTRGAKRGTPVPFRTISLGGLDTVGAGEIVAVTLRLESRKDVAGWRLLAGG